MVHAYLLFQTGSWMDIRTEHLLMDVPGAGN